jgi:NADH:ubiquinone oxidoreductase subunit C
MRSKNLKAKGKIMSKGNSIAIGSAYLKAQEALHQSVVAEFSHSHQVLKDKLNETILWAKNPSEAKILVRKFMSSSEAQIDFLSDLTAYDNQDGEDGEKRFVLVYQLYSTKLHIRIRVKTLIDLDEEAESICDLFLGANWLEREVFDMYGIIFKNHPNLRRILMDERFTGHPLRKEYPIKHREPFADNIALHLGASPIPGSK